jgi:hypothetical protein
MMREREPFDEPGEFLLILKRKIIHRCLNQLLLFHWIFAVFNSVWSSSLESVS